MCSYRGEGEADEEEILVKCMRHAWCCVDCNGFFSRAVVLGNSVGCLQPISRRKVVGELSMYYITIFIGLTVLAFAVNRGWL